MISTREEQLSVRAARLSIRFWSVQRRVLAFRTAPSFLFRLVDFLSPIIEGDAEVFQASEVILRDKRLFLFLFRTVSNVLHHVPSNHHATDEDDQTKDNIRCDQPECL